MRDIKNKLTPGKNTKNIQNRKGKTMFGYNVLGFGSGGGPVNPFIVATGGSITTVDTNFKVHTFTGPGTFSVCCGGTAAGSNGVDYLVIAGGGSGGGHNCAGGGGAGGFRESVPSPAAWSANPRADPGGALEVSSGTNYPITVGDGGPGSPAGGGPAGSNSIFSTITSAGGGKGAGSAPQAGGSGGGGSPGVPAGGAGNSPPTTPAQGYNGAPNSGPNRGGGGGGGGARGCGGSGGAGRAT